MGELCFAAHVAKSAIATRHATTQLSFRLITKWELKWERVSLAVASPCSAGLNGNSLWSGAVSHRRLPPGCRPWERKRDLEGYAKLPVKMIKKLSDLRTQAAGGAASEGFA
jgi:hypothetical protein